MLKPFSDTAAAAKDPTVVRHERAQNVYELFLIASNLAKSKTFTLGKLKNVYEKSNYYFATRNEAKDALIRLANGPKKAEAGLALVIIRNQELISYAVDSKNLGMTTDESITQFSQQQIMSMLLHGRDRREWATWVKDSLSFYAGYHVGSAPYAHSANVNIVCPPGIRTAAQLIMQPLLENEWEKLGSLTERENAITRFLTRTDLAPETKCEAHCALAETLEQQADVKLDGIAGAWSQIKSWVSLGGMGAAERALAQYQSAFECNPLSLRALDNLVRMYTNQQDHQRARFVNFFISLISENTNDEYKSAIEVEKGYQKAAPEFVAWCQYMRSEWRKAPKDKPNEPYNWLLAKVAADAVKLNEFNTAPLPISTRNLREGVKQFQSIIEPMKLQDMAKNAAKLITERRTVALSAAEPAETKRLGAAAPAAPPAVAAAAVPVPVKRLLPKPAPHSLADGARHTMTLPAVSSPSAVQCAGSPAAPVSGLSA